jgi:peptidylprolyl isomerase
MKRIAALVITFVMTVLLSACSSSSSGSGPSVSYQGVTVTNASDLKVAPTVTSKSSDKPSALGIKDIVVGGGEAASPTATVQVQYVGVRYADGVKFDSSWERGQAATFPLTGVVPGFTQGIGGASGIAPMKVGGRRIMILPADLAYGASGRPPEIPANAPLVFVVDLIKVTPSPVG